MHTFTGRSNRIVWEITVHGEIPNWPDVQEKFTLDVPPTAGATVMPVDDEAAARARAARAAGGAA
jgi:hypothetical protein